MASENVSRQLYVIPLRLVYSSCEKLVALGPSVMQTAFELPAVMMPEGLLFATMTLLELSDAPAPTAVSDNASAANARAETARRRTNLAPTFRARRCFPRARGSYPSPRISRSPYVSVRQTGR